MTAPAKPSPRPDRLMQFAWGYAPPLIIGTAVRQKLFDHLDAGPKNIEDLSRDTGLSPRGLRALLNSLVSLDLLTKDGTRYSLTPESATFLVTTKPSFQGGLFRHISTRMVPKWLHLEDAARTGRPAAAVNQEDTGSAFFQQFVEDIFPMSYGAARALADHLKLASSTRPVKVLDLASGSGVWGIALAQASQQVSVAAVDWPGVLDVTRRVAARFNVGDRFSYVAGDLESVDFGRGFDVATLGHILHSQGPAGSRSLIAKTFASLAPGGTIAIAEFLSDDTRTGPPVAMFFAVNMLVNTDTGDTFTVPEITAWLTEAGFTDVRTLDAPGPSPLILATKPA